jgi:uncharacterized protein (TIGR03435 family)
MPEPDDFMLLKQYAEGDESAFTALFERHVHLIYSVALRQVRNPSHAEEITQAVFILLARKAKLLSPKIVLSGWLYQAARLTAAGLIKREIRRQHREQEVYMQTLTESETSLWEQIAPLLDDAMGRLSEQDRNAIVLRFFENRTPQEVAGALKLNEVAARKRVSRALEKLRNFFAKRGVISTAAIIAGAISGNSVQAAPAALAHSATAVALAKGTAASTSTLTLVKGALKIMAWTKMKTIGAISAAILLAGGTTTVIVEKLVAEPTIDESLWKTDSGTFQKVPPVLIIRPTKSGYRSGSLNDSSGKAMLLNATVSGLLGAAYGIPEPQMVLPDNLPAGHFDLMLTLRDNPREALQKEIKKRFGLVGHIEERDADALALKIKNENAAGLVHSHGGTGGSFSSMSSMSSFSASGRIPPEVAARLHLQNGGSGDQITMNNQTLADFAKSLERRLNKQVYDQTGSTNRFDIKLQVQAQAGESAEDALKRSLLEQLGLELVSTNMPIEMLVVEKMK